jgi:hypothetical protein
VRESVRSLDRRWALGSVMASVSAATLDSARVGWDIGANDDLGFNYAVQFEAGLGGLYHLKKRTCCGVHVLI